MVNCASRSHCWSDLTKYKLLINQTAHHSPGRSWLKYDLVYQKDVAATGASDWSRMNLDLYNFHLHSPAYSLTMPASCGSPLLMTTNQRELCPAPFGTEIAVFATPAAHIVETFHGSTAHSIPLAPSTSSPPSLPRKGSNERVQMPTIFPVHSV